MTMRIQPSHGVPCWLGFSAAGRSVNASVSNAVDGTAGDAVTFGGDLHDSGDVASGITDMIVASDFEEIDGGGELDLSAATVRVVYSDESGENTAALDEWRGSAA